MKILFVDGTTEKYHSGHSARDDFFMNITIKYGIHEGIP